MKNAEFRKYSKHDTKHMENLVSSTTQYINISIPRFNKIQTHLKSLSTNNAKQIKSNTALLSEVTDYQKAVCSKKKRESYFHVENTESLESGDHGEAAVYILNSNRQSVLLVVDEEQG